MSLLQTQTWPWRWGLPGLEGRGDYVLALLYCACAVSNLGDLVDFKGLVLELQLHITLTNGASTHALLMMVAQRIIVAVSCSCQTFT